MNTGQNPKGYNNNAAWEKIEQDSLKKKNQGYKVVSEDTDIFSQSDEIQEIEDASLDNSNILEPEIVSPEVIQPVDTPSNDDFSDVLETPRSSGTSYTTILDEQSSSGEFDDVLTLTEYTGGGLVSNENTDFVVAEYEKIDVINIDKEQQLTAKRFVSKITKFILDFNDVKLTKAHEDYIKQVGSLQLANLTDLLTLVEVNKQMISNIVARVNAVQAEDYAIINAYNNLVNQHLKLIKEASNLYKSIPNVMKKMRADVLSNQELEASNENDELITEDYGEKQFNNSKQMLKAILDKRKADSEKKQS